MSRQSSKTYFNTKQEHLTAARSHYTVKLASRLASRLGINPHDAVLEVGAGEGRFTLSLVERGLDITALDFSEYLISKLRTRDIPCILGDIDEIENLTKKKFDFCIGFFVLHHLTDIVTSLKSIRGVLGENGRIGFIEPNALNAFYYVQPFLSSQMSWDEEKGFRDMRRTYLTSVLEQSGYHDIEFETFGFFPPFVVNTSWGLTVETLLERFPLWRPLLPFLLITARK